MFIVAVNVAEAAEEDEDDWQIAALQAQAEREARVRAQDNVWIYLCYILLKIKCRSFASGPLSDLEGVLN